ncbi:hypothetical protein BDV95DRAFT_613295 [Massariosphaeria phaeospora]|uniref:Surfeit locus protein 5 subunit 22 of mediator complex-domain-containing protein n=1 Tax=Massariosphaeria phaeospora TaxID=100035 RepID=A0A7C8MAS8_9PLEO|nr:hypothetical protein BDV95DRAFT_613295 [Massariosphaeria phaeospora]
MDASKRNANALHERVNALYKAAITHFSNIFNLTPEDDDDADSNNNGAPRDATDYAAVAHKELAIRVQATALIRTLQDLSTLIRDLQELWLFGGLDTLTDPADDAAMRAKALGIAALVEVLAKTKMGGGGGGTGVGVGEWKEGKRVEGADGR